MDVYLWVLLIALVMALVVYLAMRFGERDGRGHRGHDKSDQRYLDEVEQPKRFWF